MNWSVGDIVLGTGYNNIYYLLVITYSYDNIVVPKMSPYLVPQERQKTNDLSWLLFSLLGYSQEGSETKRNYGDKMRMTRKKLRCSDRFNQSDEETVGEILAQVFHARGTHLCLFCCTPLTVTVEENGETQFECPSCHRIMGYSGDFFD